ncbi:MAG TPA: hypothetical protein VG435_19780 [Acidimicrobiales bacterium]|nr:hypothetical protein [Acidimicrobiales bacterium]
MTRRALGRVAGAGLLVATTLAFSVADAPRALADPSAPPPFPASCLNQVSGQPAKGASATAKYTPYEVPFKAIIFDGSIDIPPNIKVPHLFASACGDVQLPSLSGTITASEIQVADPNVYVAGLEALPTTISFTGLNASISLTPAHNGGLDITVKGGTMASVTTLGITCSIVLNASFTTLPEGNLPSQPVTGPTQQGQAVTVSNTFAVPAVIGSDSGKCPPLVAQAFNKALGLPTAPGQGTFVAPFCFDFELMQVSIPKATPHCPWPQS